jgi:hypothetical protein
MTELCMRICYEAFRIVDHSLDIRIWSVSGGVINIHSLNLNFIWTCISSTTNSYNVLSNIFDFSILLEFLAFRILFTDQSLWYCALLR